jgi:hypothetical protein
MSKEIQFHLSVMYRVLGQGGYLLHHKLSELDHALGGTMQMDDLVENAFRVVRPSEKETMSAFDLQNFDVSVASSTFDPTTRVTTALPAPDSLSSDERRLFEMGTPKTTGGLPEGTPATKPWPHAVDLSPSAGADVAGISDVERQRLLHDLEANRVTLSWDAAFLAILESGASAASANPRDVSSFFCLHHLLSLVPMNKSSTVLPSDVNVSTNLIEYSRLCLVRCFALCGQATSKGMAGWLEYGGSDPVARLREGPANLLILLAGSYAKESKWIESQAVLETLVLKYERELPVHHPLLIASLLKLAAVAVVNSNVLFMKTLVARATESVSEHLLGLESSFMSYMDGCSAHDKSGTSDPLFCVEDGSTTLGALRWFVSTFHQSIADTETALWLSGNHDNPVICIYHSLVADAIAVLANCSASLSLLCRSTNLTSLQEDNATSYKPKYFWKLALAHYKTAFVGLFSNQQQQNCGASGFKDARVCGAAFGMARCLRELGEVEKALELLSCIVSALEADSTEGVPSNLVAPRSMSSSTSDHAITSASRPPYLLFVMHFHALEAPSHVHHFVTVALCLWQMSVLSVDCSPDEQGRTRAFGLLHAASVSLQLALTELPDLGPGVVPGAATIMGILQTIENEAKKISKPSGL